MPSIRQRLTWLLQGSLALLLLLVVVTVWNQPAWAEFSGVDYTLTNQKPIFMASSWPTRPLQAPAAAMPISAAPTSMAPSSPRRRFQRPIFRGPTSAVC